LIAEIRLPPLWRMSIIHCTHSYQLILLIRQSLFPALLSKVSESLAASDEFVIKTPIFSCLQQMAFHVRIGRSLLTAESIIY
jgi:hypothetical protein